MASFVGINYFCWNIGLGSGFWEYVVALLVLWTAFVCQALSMAEMTGTLPFTSGTYALTRVTMGPWLGFLTAMLEIAQSLLSFVLGVWYLSDLISNQASGGGDLKLIVSIPLLFGFCMFNIWMQKETPSTWVWILVGAGTVLFLWLVFFVGAATNLDFNTFALEPLNQEK
eukprot:gene17577-22215_t